MVASLFATFVALGIKPDVLIKDRPTAGLGCIYLYRRMATSEPKPFALWH